jgi:hypothetical protein
MWFHVQGFPNCSYHFEWPLATLEDPQLCLTLNLKEPYLKATKKSLHQPPKIPYLGGNRIFGWLDYKFLGV